MTKDEIYRKAREFSIRDLSTMPEGDQHPKAGEVFSLPRWTFLAKFAGVAIEALPYEAKWDQKDRIAENMFYDKFKQYISLPDVTYNRAVRTTSQIANHLQTIETEARNIRVLKRAKRMAKFMLAQTTETFDQKTHQKKTTPSIS